MFASRGTTSGGGLAQAVCAAALLLGCTVPNVDYYDAAVEKTPGDTGAPDRTIPGEESGPGVPPGADGNEGGEAASDSARDDVTSQVDSADSAVAPEDAQPEAADASATADSAAARPVDASGEDGETDPPNTCPKETPPGAATCCAHTPCAESPGHSCSNCGSCASMHCSAWCCANSQGGISCVAGPVDCH